MTELRIYGPDECDTDGYPFAWHKGDPAVKDLIREQADHRCVRCCHPYWKGEGEWSPCDLSCDHDGPFRGWAGGRIAWLDEGPNRNRAQHYLVDESYERLDAQWRILTVHHLTGVKADLRWWNLAALCQRCHLTIQGRVHMEQVYPHPHSEWFKPYAAGYYAAAYRGLDISREFALEHLDELLGLELAA